MMGSLFMRIQYLIMSVAMCAISLLAGCATTEVGKDIAEEQEAGATGQQSGIAGAGGTLDASTTTPLGKDSELKLDALHDPESPLSIRVIYFDFDSKEVSADSLEIVTAHGQFLANNPNQRMRLEGHADERGSREYNLGLGERRAQSVSQLLKLQGVGTDQLEMISYGEELPASFGHDEQSWALNRRVEIVYIDQER